MIQSGRPTEKGCWCSAGKRRGRIRRWTGGGCRSIGLSQSSRECTDRLRAAKVNIIPPRPGENDFPYPKAWTDAGVLFTAGTGNGDAENIWLIRVDTQTGRAVDDARRLTVGSSRETTVAATRDGHLAISSDVVRHVILDTLDANTGRATGALKRLRSDAGYVSRASASIDGQRLAFGLLKFSESQVWLKDLRTGDERQLAVAPQGALNPIISADGQWVGARRPPMRRAALAVQVPAT